MNAKEELTKLIMESYDRGVKDAKQEALTALEKIVEMVVAAEREAWQDTRKTWVDVPLKNVLREKRTWVGMTDEEVEHIADSEWEEAFVRLIEAKLKEKNT